VQEVVVLEDIEHQLKQYYAGTSITVTVGDGGGGGTQGGGSTCWQR
jgi:hypothetical protein